VIPNIGHVIGERIHVASQVETPVFIVAVVVVQAFCKMKCLYLNFIFHSLDVVIIMPKGCNWMEFSTLATA